MKSVQEKYYDHFEENINTKEAFIAGYECSAKEWQRQLEDLEMKNRTLIRENIRLRKLLEPYTKE